MTTPVDFVDDLCAAAAAAIVTAQARFLPALALSIDGATPLKVEYARAGNERFIKGPTGSCRIYAGETTLVRSCPGSARSKFVIVLSLNLTELKSASAKSKARILDAIQSTFGDNGTQFWSAFSELGSNLLGGSGRVTIADVQEDVSEAKGPANVSLVVKLEVDVWHVMPLVYEV